MAWLCGEQEVTTDLDDWRKRLAVIEQRLEETIDLVVLLAHRAHVILVGLIWSKVLTPVHVDVASIDRRERVKEIGTCKRSFEDRRELDPQDGKLCDQRVREVAVIAGDQQRGGHHV